MSEPVYVIGHKRPDTDSICASLSLARLKNKTGMNAVSARIGPLNTETSYILDKLEQKPPVLISSAKKTLDEIETDSAIVVHKLETLRYGWDLMLGNDAKTIFVVDDDGSFLGIVTLAEISKVQMQDLNITRGLLQKTPLKNLADVVHGKLLLEGTRKLSGDVRISDKKMMERDLAGAIMVLNDHEDAMIKAMAKGAAVLIVAEDFVPNDYIFEMAKAMGVSIISTPYNLMKIIQMIYRAIPVELIMTHRDDAISFHPQQYIEDVEREMLKTRHSAYPIVVDNHLVGSVARYHLLKAEPKKFILVDHNESKQSIDDLDQGEILEIVDHHRIGDIETSKPIIFRNMTVGCSCTIVSLMYQENEIEMDPETAKLCLYAMISDTMNFKSPTCTPTDVRVAKQLEKKYGLSADEMAKDLYKNTATIEGKPFQQILYNDCKEFDLNGNKVAISQVFVFDSNEATAIEPDFKKYMEEQAKAKGIELWLMVFTSVEGDGSKFLAAGPLAHLIEPNLPGFEKAGYVSRKKQIVPAVHSLLR